MRTPLNEIDYQRFLKLAEVVRKEGKEAELNIWILDDYVHIELTGRKIPKEKLQNIFKLPVEELLNFTPKVIDMKTKKEK